MASEVAAIGYPEDKPRNEPTYLVETLIRQFEDSEQSTAEARQASETDRDYHDNKQWTGAERAALEKRGQPAITRNEIQPKINIMLGVEKQTRKDPKAFPRNPQDEDAANAATDAIRYVCDDSQWDDKRSSGAKNLALEGTMAFMVGVKETKTGYDPKITRIAWDRFYYDPYSSEEDFSDAMFKGIVVWMDLDEAISTYPGAKEVLTSTWLSSVDDTYDDKPKHALWADRKRRRVRLCEHYWKSGGTWKYCVFTKGGFVVDAQDSPYLCGEGKPECPIYAVSLYVDRENNRYGEVRSMRPVQDEINKRASKGLALISQRQIRVSPSVSLDPNAIRKELARPDGVFVGMAGDVEIIPTSDMAHGNFQMMQDAREHMLRLGPNAAMAGKSEGAQSGRAIIAQQQGGMTEATTYLDRIRQCSVMVYRGVWNRIRQFWDEERWIRITDDDKNTRFVGLNQPVTLLQATAKQMGVSKDNLQSAPPEVLQQLQMLAADPRSQQVVAIENNVTELDVDIQVDEGIDTPTVQAEQFDILAKMLPGLGEIGQTPAAIKLLIQASALRDKGKLMEIIEPKEQQGPPPPTPEQMMQAQREAQIAEAQFEGSIEIEKAKIAGQADIEVAKIRAEADFAAKEGKNKLEAAFKERQAVFDFEAQSRIDDETGETERKHAEAQLQLALLEQLQAMSRPKVRTPVRDENGLIVQVIEETMETTE